MNYSQVFVIVIGFVIYFKGIFFRMKKKNIKKLFQYRYGLLNYFFKGYRMNISYIWFIFFNNIYYNLGCFYFLQRY